MVDPRELVREQFGAHAQAYVTSEVHAKGESLARLVELTQPKPDWRVLDVSTGAGHTAFAFAPRVATVVATDLAEQMLDAARTLARDRGIANVEFRTADAHALPFGDATFDLVTSRLALHHYPDAESALREMARVCRPAGLVALVDNVVPGEAHAAAYINRFEQVRDRSHIQAASVQDLERCFRNAGLAAAHVETLSKEMAFEPWVRRMGASADTQERVRDLLLEAPPAARDFLAPREQNGALFFRLTEAILVGRKP